MTSTADHHAPAASTPLDEFAAEVRTAITQNRAYGEGDVAAVISYVGEWPDCRLVAEYFDSSELARKHFRYLRDFGGNREPMLVID